MSDRPYHLILNLSDAASCFYPTVPKFYTEHTYTFTYCCQKYWMCSVCYFCDDMVQLISFYNNILYLVRSQNVPNLPDAFADVIPWDIDRSVSQWKESEKKKNLRSRSAPRVNGFYSRLRPILHLSLVEIRLVLFVESCWQTYKWTQMKFVEEIIRPFIWKIILLKWQKF